MNGWLTIDTAPRDGSRFLAYAKHGKDWYIIIAGFAKNGILFDENDGSCIAWDPCGKNGKLRENFPMWQPLPEPPNSALDDEGNPAGIIA